MSGSTTDFGRSVGEVEIRTRALRLSALQWGGDDERPVLGLHGWLDNAATFAELAPRLPGTRFVSLDLPGHGRSEHHPPGYPYAFVDLVAEVYDAVQSLGWSRLVLMGHSLGAAVSAVLAGVLGPRLDALILIEGLGPLTEDPQQAPERLTLAIREQAEREGKRSRVFSSPTEAAERLCQARTKLTPEAAQILANRGLQAVPGGFSWSYDPSLTLSSRMRFTESHVHAFLRRIRIPTLLVRARDGWPVPQDVMADRLACISDLSLEMVDGGHHVHLEAADEVATVVRAFLDRHPP